MTVEKLPTGYRVCSIPGCPTASREPRCRTHRYRPDLIGTGADVVVSQQTQRYTLDHAAPPVPWQRTRAGRRTEQRYGDWKAGFVAAARRALSGQGPVAGPVSLDVEVSAQGVRVSVRPVSPGRPAGLRGDADNYLKAVADGLQDAGVYDNDSAVVAATVRLVDGGDGR